MDNTSVDQFTASDGFTRAIDIPADIKVGRHTVTVTASADGRYAPALTDAVLDVSKARCNSICAFQGNFRPGRT